MTSPAGILAVPTFCSATVRCASSAAFRAITRTEVSRPTASHSRRWALGPTAKWCRDTNINAVRETSMRTICLFLGAAAIACGCSKSVPTQAGGKPVAYWIQELKNPDAKARRHAVAKLGNVGETDPAVLPGLE